MIRSVAIELDARSLAIFDSLLDISKKRTFDSIQKKARASASRKMKVAIKREIRVERPIKLSALDSLVRPLFGSDRVGFVVSGDPVEVRDLPHRIKAEGVAFQSRRSEGWVTIVSAFRATMPSGHTGIFKRTSAERLPISKRYAPGVSVVFVDEGRRKAVLDAARLEYEKTFERLAKARLDAV